MERVRRTQMQFREERTVFPFHYKNVSIRLYNYIYMRDSVVSSKIYRLNQQASSELHCLSISNRIHVSLACLCSLYITSIHCFSLKPFQSNYINILINNKMIYWDISIFKKNSKLYMQRLTAPVYFQILIDTFGPAALMYSTGWLRYPSSCYQCYYVCLSIYR